MHKKFFNKRFSGRSNQNTNTPFIHATAEETLSFPLFSPAMRIGYGVMLLCIIAASTLMYSENRQLPVLGIVFGCFTLFVLCYVDCWTFNCSTKTIKYRNGVAFMTARTHYSFSDIEKAETEHFTKGLFKTAYIKCILHLQNGEKKTVAIFSEQNQKCTAQWERISALMHGV